MGYVISDALHNCRDQVATELLAFAVDVGIASAREIYALEGAPLIGVLAQYVPDAYIASLVDYKRAARSKLTDLTSRDVRTV